MSESHQNRLLSLVQLNNTSKTFSNVRDLVPNEIENYATKFIDFIEEYYKWLEQSGNPGEVLNSLYTQRDIDFANKNSLLKLKEELLASLPNKFIIDDKTLLKTIYTIYQQKGSLEGFRSFFKVFFGDTITVYYPWKDVLKPSDGVWNESTGKWIDNRGFISDRIYLQDSWYYQRFSYDIISKISLSEWESSISKALHPAGYKLFGTLFLLILITLSAVESSINLGSSMPREQWERMVPPLFSYFSSLVVIPSPEVLFTIIDVIYLVINKIPGGGKDWNSRLYGFDFGSIAEIETLTQPDLENLEKNVSALIQKSFAVSISSLADTVTLSEHELVDNKEFYFSSLVNSTYGVSTYTKYFVTNKTTNTFKVATQRDGIPINISGNTTGIIVYSI
jgi:hypothetical protein